MDLKLARYSYSLSHASIIHHPNLKVKPILEARHSSYTNAVAGV
jgi:hypothetical protein